MIVMLKGSLVEIKKLTLLRCEDPCAKGKSFVTSNHDGLKQQVARLHLQSSSARNRMQDTFADNLKASKSWSPWNLYRLSQKLNRWMSFSTQRSEASQCHHIRGRSQMVKSMGASYASGCDANARLPATIATGCRLYGLSAFYPCRGIRQDSRRAA